MDTDRSGYITLPELLAYAHANPEQVPFTDDQLRGFFSQGDADGDSRLSGFEFYYLATGGQQSSAYSSDCPYIRPPGADAPGPVGGEEGGLSLKCCDPETGCCRLDIFHAGEMGTICDDGVGDEVAKVACRQMGLPFQTATAMVGGAGWEGSGVTPGTGPIWLDSLVCQGDEESISDCDHQPWGEHNCEHQEDVGICCGSGSGAGDVPFGPRADPL